MEAPTLLQTLFNISNKIFALVSNLKGYFSFLKQIFRLKASIFHRERADLIYDQM